MRWTAILTGLGMKQNWGAGRCDNLAVYVAVVCSQRTKEGSGWCSSACINTEPGPAVEGYTAEYAVMRAFGA
jgi:hypothetical protein